MNDFLSHFKFAQFQFVLKVEDCIYLPPYKGATFRGAFGHAFKKVVCVSKDKTCSSCILKGKCVYSYVFETPPPSDTSKMRKYPFAPHPFVITPPLEEKRTYKQNDMLRFELTLVGKSIDFLPYFIYTFDELGRMGIGKGKGKYQLEEVRAIQAGERSKDKGEREEKEGKRSKVKGERSRDDEATLIYSGKDKTLKNSFNVLRACELSPITFHLPPSPNLSPLTLNLIFMTPTRLKYDGNLSPRPEFHILFRNLLRRISLLSYFHCGEELDLDFKGLIERSREVKVQKENLSWFDWERYSNRQEIKMKMGGFTGSITFEGDIEQFLPFLTLGEYIHVGKGTSFGLGKYEIRS
jgi:CRISPR-associated endoribonuclease Cas6